jgi:hypothetical protein
VRRRLSPFHFATTASQGFDAEAYCIRKELRPNHKLATIWDVALMGSQAFENLIVSIKLKISGHGTIIELYERQIETLKKKVAGRR